MPSSRFSHRFVPILRCVTLSGMLAAAPPPPAAVADPAAGQHEYREHEIDLKERPELNTVADGAFLERAALLGIPETPARLLLEYRSRLGFLEAAGQLAHLPGIGKRHAAMIALHFSISAPVAEPEGLTGPDDPQAGSVIDPETENALLELEETRQILQNTPLELNTADMPDLLQLPLVDETLAARIISRRRRRPFTARWELLAVRGIDIEHYRRMRPFVRVDPVGESRTLSGAWSLRTATTLPGRTGEYRYGAALSWAGWHLALVGENGPTAVPSLALVKRSSGWLRETASGIYRLKLAQGLLFGSAWGTPAGPKRPGGVLPGGRPGAGKLWGQTLRVDGGPLSGLFFLSSRQLAWPSDGRARLSTIAERQATPFFLSPGEPSLQETLAGGELRLQASAGGDSLGLRVIGTGFSRGILVPERRDLFHEFHGHSFVQGSVDGVWSGGPLRIAGELAVSRSRCGGDPGEPRSVPALLLAACGDFRPVWLEAFWLERQAGFQAPHGAFPDAAGTSRRGFSMRVRLPERWHLEAAFVSEQRLWQSATEVLPEPRRLATLRILFPIGGGLGGDLVARTSDRVSEDDPSAKRSLRGVLSWQSGESSLSAGLEIAADDSREARCLALRARFAPVSGLAVRIGITAHRANHPGFAVYAAEERLPGESGLSRLLYGNGTRLSLALLCTPGAGFRGGIRATCWSREPRREGSFESVLAGERRSIACFLEGRF